MADNKSFLERLSEKIAPPNKEFNMNADRVGGLAGLRAEPYASGISAEDAYKLELINNAKQANYERALGQMKTAPVSNGTIDPRYWDAAQKASDIELRGLAGRRGW